MPAYRQFSPAELLRACRRRWMWALVPALFGGLAGFLLARVVPPRFTSVATLEEDGRIAGMIQNAGPASSRLASLQHAAMTPERLATVASRFRLYSEATDGRAESSAARMSQSIDLSPAPAGFTLSFTAGDPRAAQQVCAALVPFLQQEDQRMLQRLVAASFDAMAVTAPAHPSASANSQLAAARHDLDERQSRLDDFRRQHAAELEALARHAAERKLSDDQTQLQFVNAALTNALQQKTALTDSLYSRKPPAAVGAGPAESPATQALEQELAADQAQLVALRARYTEDYPDVVKLKSDIELLQKKIAEARKSPAASPGKKQESAAAADAADLARIQAQIKQLDALIQQKSNDQERLQQEILSDRAQADAAATLDQQYRDLLAQVAAARQLYASLQSATMAPQDTDQSWPPRVGLPRLAVPPTLPSRPSFPDPVLFTVWGACAGLLAGLLGIFAGQMSDKSLRTAGDIEHFLELPTLAVIPPAGPAGGGTDVHSGTRGGRTGDRKDKHQGVLADV